MQSGVEKICIKKAEKICIKWFDVENVIAEGLLHLISQR